MIPTDDPTDVSDPTDDPDDPTGQPTGCASAAPPAFVFGAGVLPTALLGGILDRATIREVHHPGDGPPELRYTASRRLCECVRCRDLTCRFPGCDKPAQVCDVDHTVPYPVGPTHPSNLKCLCRFHRAHKRLTAGETNFVEIHRYVEVTAKRCHSPGTPLSS